MKILEIENLSKSFDGKKYALAPCTFSLEKGKICAIVGESGSGKSTLLRLISGLERPTSGSIKIAEKTVSNDTFITPPQDREVGLVFQDFALFPHKTVGQNITFGLKENKKSTLRKLLQLIKMETYSNAYPSELSGGQEQRVAIARTLAVNPRLLLLDEPFSSLDVALKTELRQEIRQIVKKIGTSMMFITHDFTDAIHIADEVLLLKEGILLEKNEIKDLFKNTKNDEIKNIIQDLKINAERILKIC